MQIDRKTLNAPSLVCVCHMCHTNTYTHIPAGLNLSLAAAAYFMHRLFGLYGQKTRWYDVKQTLEPEVRTCNVNQHHSLAWLQP